jgi:hypothetical protein
MLRPVDLAMIALIFAALIITLKPVGHLAGADSGDFAEKTVQYR